MKPQFSNQLLSNFLLWLDHQILEKGDAYTNIGSVFYPIPQRYANYYPYSMPYGQIVADSSLTGATIMTGVYVNNIFVGTGVSGFVNIDYNRGNVYFTDQANKVVSGNFAVKDYTIKLTNDSDETILFENEYQLRTGLHYDETTYPVVYVKNNTSYNQPAAFGGLENSIHYIRCFIIGKSLFSVDAVCSIMMDSARSRVPLLADYEMPYNAIGGLTSGTFDYNLLVTNRLANNTAAYIAQTNYLSYSQNVSTNLKKANNKAYISIVDFELEYHRFPRL